MGCNSSSRQILPDKLQDFYLIGFNHRDIKKLSRAFYTLDVNTNGTVDLTELLSVYNMDDSPYMVHIFNRVVKHDNKEINLYEFILCMWLFLTYDEKSLLQFTFEMYDYNKSRALTKTGFLDLLTMAYGKRAIAVDTYKTIVERIMPKEDPSNEHLEFTKDHFEAAMRLSPHILKHALQLQDSLRQRLIGRDFWKGRKQTCLVNPAVRNLFIDIYSPKSTRRRRIRPDGEENSNFSEDSNYRSSVRSNQNSNVRKNSVDDGQNNSNARKMSFDYEKGSANVRKTSEKGSGKARKSSFDNGKNTANVRKSSIDNRKDASEEQGPTGGRRRSGTEGRAYRVGSAEVAADPGDALRLVAEKLLAGPNGRLGSLDLGEGRRSALSRPSSHKRRRSTGGPIRWTDQAEPYPLADLVARTTAVADVAIIRPLRVKDAYKQAEDSLLNSSAIVEKIRRRSIS